MRIGTYTDRRLYRKYRKFKPLDLKTLDYYGLGTRIRMQREAKDLTRDELASFLGITPSYMGDIEYGTKATTVKNVFALSKKLDVTMHYLLTGCNDLTSNSTSGTKLRIARNMAATLSKCTAHEIRCILEMIEAFVSAIEIQGHPDTREEYMEEHKVIKLDFTAPYPMSALSFTCPADRDEQNSAQALSNKLLLGVGYASEVTLQDAQVNLAEMALRIKDRRVELKLGRVDIAEYLDVSEPYSASLEYGEKCISLPRFYTIMQVLECTADYLAHGGIAEPIFLKDKASMHYTEKICSTALSLTVYQAECMFNIIKSSVKAFYTETGSNA